MMFVGQISNHNTGWKIVGLVDEEEISSDISGIKSLIFIVSIICFILFCLITMGMTAYIIKQIKKVNNL